MCNSINKSANTRSTVTSVLCDRRGKYCGAVDSSAHDGQDERFKGQKREEENVTRFGNFVLTPKKNPSNNATELQNVPSSGPNKYRGIPLHITKP